VDAYGMKTAVDIANTLTRYKATPVPVLSMVSHALEPYPDLQVDKIDWTAGVDPQTAVTGVAPAAASPARSVPAVAPAAPAAASPATYPYYHIAEISGHITSFDGDYQRALDRVNAFSGTLKTQPSVYEVRVLAQPLDVSSSASLQGSTSAEVKSQEARFNVRVVLGVKSS